MTPEAQRIAIAEACGWTQVKQCTCKHHPCGIRPGKTDEAGKWGGPHVPDYLRDLNAMHEAEELLAYGGLRGEYVKTISKIITGVDECIQWPTVMATAAHRAEAFLRTLGKWDDSK